MDVPEEAALLRIFIGENARFEGKPLYEALAMKAREEGLAGATVIRGIQGFGQASHLHTAKILRLSLDLPMIVEIVDSEDKIHAFLKVNDPMMSSGMVTIERARVLRYGAPKAE
jgi:PII-like signaling protein